MLKIINNLNPFFEDCYRRINVREYAKILKISPPTASKVLTNYHKEGLLKKETFRNYLFYYANQENKEFTSLSRMYWGEKLKELISFLDKHLTQTTIVLFGSLAKAEVRPESDIDLAIFGHKKNLNLNQFEKEMKRSIQLIWFKSIKDIKNKELAQNILNGHVLKGRMKL